MKRLVLFDIDGTLVSGGPAKEAFHHAMMEVFGTAGDIEVHSFAGKTDPQIARELLTGAGLAPEAVDRGLPALWSAYLRELEARLPNRPMEVLPGARNLVDALEATGEVALGLVTGNIARGARLKLSASGLSPRFRVGGYGSDHEARNHLPGIAMARARAAWEVEFAPDAVWIVGDTPRDVACGRHAGTRTLAVATGGYDAEALRATGPDRVVEDLTSTRVLVEALLDGV